jgi:uncharacterized protein
MLTLTPDECRVLGVLIEKAQTTPGQYPLTLNALVVGSNQKNNREPITNLGDERTLDALDGLRKKGLAREVNLAGSRVEKYRHIAREALNVSTPELVVLAELLLRGPQSAGEIRARATRMHPLESLEAVEEILKGLATRPEPLVRELAPFPGTRAVRYAQLLWPTLHPLHAPPPGPAGAGEPDEVPAPERPAITQRLERLEAEVAALRATVARLAGALGEPVPPDA